MAQTKKMNTNFFAKMHKDLTATVEKLRARQDEKQAILDQFDRESKRFFFGKISERALASSVKKTNKEISRLDKAIRDIIVQAKKISDRERTLVAAQVPISFKATLTGIAGGKKKKKIVKKIKKVVKRKTVKKTVKKRKPVAKKKVTKRKKRR